MTVDEFLLARLDELAAAARAAEAVNPAPWRVFSSQLYGDIGLVLGGGTPDNRYLDGALWDNEGASSLSMEIPTAQHVALHDPGYVLADYRAKRRIIEDYRAVANNPARFRDAAAHLCAHVLLRVVTTLAQPFAAHPDFDHEWQVPA